MIDEMDGVDVVVPYAEASRLLEELRITEDEQKKKMFCRRLQRFTVHLSDTWMRKLGDAVYGIEENRFLYWQMGITVWIPGWWSIRLKCHLLDF